MIIQLFFFALSGAPWGWLSGWERGVRAFAAARTEKHIYTTLYGGCSFIAFLFSLRSIVFVLLLPPPVGSI